MSHAVRLAALGERLVYYSSLARMDEFGAVISIVAVLGVGICFLPEAFAAPDVEAGRLWPLLRHEDQPCMPVFVITNPRAPSKLARQLLLAEIGIPGGAN